MSNFRSTWQSSTPPGLADFTRSPQIRCTTLGWCDEDTLRQWLTVARPSLNIAVFAQWHLSKSTIVQWIVITLAQSINLWGKLLGPNDRYSWASPIEHSNTHTQWRVVSCLSEFAVVQWIFIAQIPLIVFVMQNILSFNLYDVANLAMRLSQIIDACLAHLGYLSASNNVQAEWRFMFSIS